MIDDLQALRESIESTMNAIVTENAERQAAMYEPYSWFDQLGGLSEPPVGPSEPFVGPYVPPPDNPFEVSPLWPTER